MTNFESAFLWFAVFLILFLNFKTLVKYIEKQTELNYICLCVAIVTVFPSNLDVFVLIWRPKFACDGWRFFGWNSGCFYNFLHISRILCLWFISIIERQCDQFSKNIAIIVVINKTIKVYEPCKFPPCCGLLWCKEPRQGKCDLIRWFLKHSSLTFAK